MVDLILFSPGTKAVDAYGYCVIEVLLTILIPLKYSGAIYS